MDAGDDGRCGDCESVCDPCPVTAPWMHFFREEESKVKNRGGRDARYLPYYSVPMAQAPFTIPIFVFCCCKLENAVRSSSSTV
uniref:Uncharacterized protein n=1 Tax=Oryza sativa subsp. japonica TaxID=39947 RepID=Q6ZL60_ORYSJ|nr:hypothetical protein [Oryza sativa Japonica Group]